MHLRALLAILATTTPAFARFSNSTALENAPGGREKPIARPPPAVAGPPIVLAPIELPRRDLAVIEVTPPDDSRIKIAHSVRVREVGDVELVTMTITASSTISLWHATELTVSIPRAARVIGLALEQGGTMRDARLTRASEAREQYTDNVRVEVDPALVELESHVRDYDRIRLSMYPVSNEQPATVELTIRLPRVDKLVVELPGKHEAYEAGTADPADLALLDRPAVTGGLSLYVGPAEDTAAEIRNLVRAGTRPLGRCLPDGDAVDLDVHFTIETDGNVTASAASIAEAIARRPGQAWATTDVANCIAGVLGMWHFHRGDKPIVVDTPLHLAH